MTEAEQLARDSAARYAREVDVLGDRLTIVERERDALAARLAAVEALHHPISSVVTESGAMCADDEMPWPCSTARALAAAVRAEPSATTP